MRNTLDFTCLVGLLAAAMGCSAAVEGSYALDYATDVKGDTPADSRGVPLAAMPHIVEVPLPDGVAGLDGNLPGSNEVDWGNLDRHVAALEANAGQVAVALSGHEADAVAGTREALAECVVAGSLAPICVGISVVGLLRVGGVLSAVALTSRDRNEGTPVDGYRFPDGAEVTLRGDEVYVVQTEYRHGLGWVLIAAEDGQIIPLDDTNSVEGPENTRIPVLEGSTTTEVQGGTTHEVADLTGKLSAFVFAVFGFGATSPASPPPDPEEEGGGEPTQSTTSVLNAKQLKLPRQRPQEGYRAWLDRNVQNALRNAGYEGEPIAHGSYTRVTTIVGRSRMATATRIQPAMQIRLSGYRNPRTYILEVDPKSRIITFRIPKANGQQLFGSDPHATWSSNAWARALQTLAR